MNSFKFYLKISYWNFLFIIRANPFERPKPKGINPTTGNAAVNKKNQMQKMDNFRDQLNKQLFGETDETNEVFGSNPLAAVEKKEVEVKREYKVPPKVMKRPELKIEENKESTN